jgi:hypothetical protein
MLCDEISPNSIGNLNRYTARINNIAINADRINTGSRVSQNKSFRGSEYRIRHRFISYNCIALIGQYGIGTTLNILNRTDRIRQA